MEFALEVSRGPLEQGARDGEANVPLPPPGCDSHPHPHSLPGPLRGGE